MKSIRISTVFLAIIILILPGACKKSFITIQPEGQFLTENYYKTRDQAYTGLVAAYDVLRKNSGGFENMITMMNAGSDDNYSGGANESDGAGIQSFSNYTINPNTIPRSFWGDHYQGVYRANVLLKRLPDVEMDAGEKARFTAETKALRAIYYFNLV